MRRSWQGLAAAGAVGAVVIGVGVGSAGGATQATAGKAAAPVRQPAAPALPRAAVRAHTAGVDALYLQLPGAPGDVTDPGYGGTIQLFNFSLGVSNNPPVGSTTPSRPQWSLLALGAQLDRATTAMESFVNTGRMVPYAVLTATSSMARQPVYRMVLGNVTVQDVSVGGAVGGGRPGVSYGLAYQSEETDEYDNGRIFKSCWDQSTETATCPTIPSSGSK